MEHIKCDGRWHQNLCRSSGNSAASGHKHLLLRAEVSRSLWTRDCLSSAQAITSRNVTRAQRFSCPRTRLVLCTVHSASPSPEVFTREIGGGAVSHCPCVQAVLLYMECSILCSEVSKNYKLTVAISCPLSNCMEQSLDKLMVAQSGRSSR